MSTVADAKAIISLRQDVTELQKQGARQEVLVDRIDLTLDKISEVSLNVSKLLAVHEQRLEAQEVATQKLPDLIEKRHEEYVSRFEIAHERMHSLDEGLRKDMSNGQKEILVEIKNLRTDMREQTDELKSDLQEDFDTKIEAVGTRVSKLEKMSWLVIGGATVIGFILSQALGLLSFLTGS